MVHLSLVELHLRYEPKFIYTKNHFIHLVRQDKFVLLIGPIRIMSLGLYISIMEVSLDCVVLFSFFSWAELKDIMRKCGEVTYTDAHYRSGDGRGEVCFETREDQERCLDEMDGFDINGKQIRVSRGVRY